MSRATPGHYDFFIRPWEVTQLRRLRRRLMSGLSGRVLEVGVGTGLTFPWYPDSVELIGIEPDRAMLEAARRRAANLNLKARLIQGDAQWLPFRNSSFDAAVGNLVMCTIPDPLRALRELRRIVSPDGELRLLEHVRGPGPVIGVLQDIVTPLWKRVANGCHPNRDTLRMVRETRWQVREVRCHFFGWKVQELLAIAHGGKEMARPTPPTVVGAPGSAEAP